MVLLLGMGKGGEGCEWLLVEISMERREGVFEGETGED